MPHEIYNAPAGSKRFMYESMIFRLENEKEEQDKIEKQKRKMKFKNKF